jgi:hypothetical protein
MKQQLSYVAPVRAGVVLAVLYAVLSVCVAPFVLLGAVQSSQSGNAGGPPIILGIGFAILMPFLYAGIGFLVGLIGAAVYNLIAKWTGGFEIELRSVTLGA